MNYGALLSAVEPKWRGPVIRFAESGEADSDFLAALDREEALQRAVDAAIREKAEALDNITTKLRDELRAGTVAVSERLAENLKSVIALGPAERKAAIDKTAVMLRSAVRSGPAAAPNPARVPPAS